MEKHLDDKNETLINKEKLFKNYNQLSWYKKLYSLVLKDYLPLNGKNVLEIGSGTSPFKYFYPEIITSDILDLDYLDMRFDCHDIDKVQEIPDGSLDIICMTNVLHHMERPVDFLNKASVKLKQSGEIILIEPFFSFISTPIYKYIHHEFCSKKISEPIIEKIEGPLRSANLILPYLIFFSSRGWDSNLKKTFIFSRKEINYFSSLSYFATGGFTKPIHVPKFLYNIFLKIDCLLTRLCPNIFSSFFIIKLKKK